MYYELLAKLMFEITDTAMLLGIFKISFKTFLIFIVIILDPLFQITFTREVLDSQFKWTHFLESAGTKFGMKCQCLRKHPKIVFKRKIKQILFEILASEDCSITWLYTRATKYNLSALGTYSERERIKCTYLDFA